MQSFESYTHNRAQARRFETQFTAEARRFLQAIEQDPERGTRTTPRGFGLASQDAKRLRRAASLADTWQATCNDGKLYDITFAMRAERMIEHPSLFRPEGTRINDDRAHNVTTSVMIHAREIGRHLEARQEARGDAQALVDRLSQALTYAHGALGCLEAARAPGAPTESLLNDALKSYRAARNLAAIGPQRPVAAGPVA